MTIDTSKAVSEAEPVTVTSADEEAACFQLAWYKAEAELIALRTQLATVAAERDTLRQSQGYLYIGNDGKAVTARALEERAIKAEAERDNLLARLSVADEQVDHLLGLSTERYTDLTATEKRAAEAFETCAKHFDSLAVLRKMWSAREVAATIRAAAKEQGQ